MRFGFADTEDAATAAHAATATPATGQEYPEADKECERQYLPEDCTEVVTLLFVVDGAVETSLVFFFLQEVTQAFARGGFCRNQRILAYTAGIGFEYIGHILGLDVCLYGVIVITGHFAYIAVAYIFLKFVVGDVFAGCTAFVGEIQSQ